jgi:hypothetical protein
MLWAIALTSGYSALAPQLLLQILTRILAWAPSNPNPTLKPVQTHGGGKKIGAQDLALLGEISSGASAETTLEIQAGPLAHLVAHLAPR